MLTQAQTLTAVATAGSFPRDMGNNFPTDFIYSEDRESESDFITWHTLTCTEEYCTKRERATRTEIFSEIPWQHRDFMKIFKRGGFTQGRRERSWFQIQTGKFKLLFLSGRASLLDSDIPNHPFLLVRQCEATSWKWGKNKKKIKQLEDLILVFKIWFNDVYLKKWGQSRLCSPFKNYVHITDTVHLYMF